MTGRSGLRIAGTYIPTGLSKYRVDWDVDPSD